MNRLWESGKSQAMEGKVRGYLQLAADASERALTATRPIVGSLRVVLDDYRTAVHGLSLDGVAGAPEGARAFLEEYRERYDATRDFIEYVASGLSTELVLSFDELEADSRFTTIVLFGRTRVGKSTTMEALTFGKGASIGVGRQHTTREVKEYFFPKNPKPHDVALRIVDTPGIEGFQGEDLGRMAEQYVDQADHVFFLLGDDKTTASELERFQFIATRGKGVTALLNVKIADEDLDLLIDEPDLVVSEEQLQQQKSRVYRYLSENLELPNPEIIHYAARAAWLSRHSSTTLPEGVDRIALETMSRIADVESRIERFVHEESVPARLRAPRDVLSSYAEKLRDELFEVRREFRSLHDSLTRVERQFVVGMRNAQKRSLKRLSDIEDVYSSMNKSIPGILDDIIAGGRNGSHLSQRWRIERMDSGVEQSIEHFRESVLKEYADQLQEKARIAEFDLRQNDTTDPVVELDGIYAKREKHRKLRNVRAGARAASSLGGAALGGAILSFLFPPAGLFVVATASIAGGIAAERAAKSVADDIVDSTENDIARDRRRILQNLKGKLASERANSLTIARSFLEEVETWYRQQLQTAIVPITDAARSISDVSLSAIDRCESVIQEMNHSLVRDILGLSVEDVSNGNIEVVSVARLPGIETKIRIRSKTCNAMAACIGTRGTNAMKVGEDLGGELVSFIDADEPMELQILQAFGFRTNRRLRAVAVPIDQGEQWIVSVPDDKREYATGVGGRKVRMVERLFATNITVKGLR